jgi:fructan beta-fructosidase
MSLPRKLSVKRVNDEWILVQQPVDEIKQLRAKGNSWKTLSITDSYELPVKSQSFELELVIRPGAASLCGIRLAKGNDHYIEIGYDAQKQVLYIDRTKSGDAGFHPSFAKLNHFETPLQTKNNKLSLHIFFDKSIIEVFANDGEAVMTAQLFPDDKNNGVELFSNSKPAVFESINYWPLKSIW